MIVFVTPRNRSGEIVTVEGEPDSGHYGGFKGNDGKLYGRSRWYRTMIGAERHMRYLLRNKSLYLERELEKVQKELRRRG